jgi:hypothetical protein
MIRTGDEYRAPLQGGTQHPAPAPVTSGVPR